MFITFEGIDCCGKSTQIQLLSKHFIAIGKEHIVLREPGNTPLSEQIRDMLLQKKYMDMSPISELLLFSASRAQLTNKVIKPALANNQIVICDRFYDSTTAYQGFGRGIALNDIERINMIATSGLKPDITFLIQISVAESYKRSSLRKGETPDRMELSGQEFFTMVAEGYRHIAKEDKERFVIINGEQPPENVFNEILSHLLSTRV